MEPLHVEGGGVDGGCPVVVAEKNEERGVVSGVGVRGGQTGGVRAAQDRAETEGSRFLVGGPDPFRGAPGAVVARTGHEVVQAGGGHALTPGAGRLEDPGEMDVEVFDVGLAAAGAEFSGKEFSEAGGPVLPACSLAYAELLLSTPTDHGSAAVPADVPGHRVVGGHV
ncbi:hypothetical protein [Streptomyces sp. bgisy126]|uniref:hypothetical protein n=1 Tax=Streptomyces sp. bgisy126 TaxID=3413787 RepID=UPI003EBB00C7